MIKVDKGNVTINGSSILLKTELAVLVNTLQYNILTKEIGMTPDESKKFIMEAVEHGFKTESEIHEEAKESLAKALEMLSEELGKIFGKGDQ